MGQNQTKNILPADDLGFIGKLPKDIRCEIFRKIVDYDEINKIISLYPQLEFEVKSCIEHIISDKPIVINFNEFYHWKSLISTNNLWIKVNVSEFDDISSFSKYRTPRLILDESLDSDEIIYLVSLFMLNYGIKGNFYVSDGLGPVDGLGMTEIIMLRQRQIDLHKSIETAMGECDPTGVFKYKGNYGGSLYINTSIMQLLAEINNKVIDTSCLPEGQNLVIEIYRNLFDKIKIPFKNIFISKLIDERNVDTLVLYYQSVSTLNSIGATSVCSFGPAVAIFARVPTKKFVLDLNKNNSLVYLLSDYARTKLIETIFRKMVTVSMLQGEEFSSFFPSILNYDRYLKFFANPKILTIFDSSNQVKNYIDELKKFCDGGVQIFYVGDDPLVINTMKDYANFSYPKDQTYLTQKMMNVVEHKINSVDCYLFDVD